MKIRTLYLMFGISLLLAGNLRAQTNASVTNDNLADVDNPEKTKKSLYIGPTFGYNKSYHSFDINTFASESKTDPCPNFNKGNDNGFHAGINVFVPFTLTNSKHAIIFRALYNSLPSFTTTKSTTSNLSSLLESPDGNTGVNTSTEHTLTVKYNVISFDLMYAFKPMQSFPLLLTIGPTIDFALTKTKTQQLKLYSDNPNVRFKKDVTDPNYSYEDDRTMNINGKDADIPSSNSLRLGFKGGIHYNINLKNVEVSPYIMYNLGVTKLSDNGNWRVNALMIGVDVRFAVVVPGFLTPWK